MINSFFHGFLGFLFCLFVYNVSGRVMQDYQAETDIALTYHILVLHLISRANPI
jgi:hypothetical protein